MRVLLSLVNIPVFIVSIFGNSDSLSIEEGGVLFKQTCTACHHLERRLVGPPLKGVNQRHDEAWLINFIRSSQSMIQAGDSTAIALFNTYNKVPMPDHNFTDVQVRSILAYIEDSEKPSSATESNIPRPVVQSAASNVRPPKFSDYRFWILYTVTVLLVIVSIYYKAELIALRKQVDPSQEE